MKNGKRITVNGERLFCGRRKRAGSPELGAGSGLLGSMCHIEIETSDIRRSDVRMTHRAVLRRPCSCEPGVRTIALKKDVTNGKRISAFLLKRKIA